MSKKTVIVVGATGIIGSYLLDHLSKLDDWNVKGIARNIPRKHPERYISMDLLDARGVKEKGSHIGRCDPYFLCCLSGLSFPYQRTN